jgi:hypothetical protein
VSKTLLVDGHIKHYAKTEPKAETEKTDKTEISLTRIHLSKDYKFFVKLESDTSRSSGRWHEIVELTVDTNNRIVARYRNRPTRARSKLSDDDLPTYQWIVMGKITR